MSCATIGRLSITFTSNRKREFVLTWPSFPFTFRLLFIIWTHVLVVSLNLLSIRIVLSCFYLLIFNFQKFSTWIWRLPFAVYVMLKLSNNYVSCIPWLQLPQRSITTAYIGPMIGVLEICPLRARSARIPWPLISTHIPQPRDFWNPPSPAATFSHPRWL